MTVRYTYTVFFWTGSYNKEGPTFPTMREAQDCLGSPRNGMIGKNRIVAED